jgi:hypothetical protein
MSKQNKTIADVAKGMVAYCVRNSPPLEDIHAGKCVITKTGDYSDVTITDADGNNLKWSEISRISDTEMKAFMVNVVNRIAYVLNGLEVATDSVFGEALASYASLYASGWQDPELVEDIELLGAVAIGALQKQQSTDTEE